MSNFRRNHRVKLAGEEATIAEAARRLAVKDPVLRARIALDWPEERWGLPLQRKRA